MELTTIIPMGETSGGLCSNPALKGLWSQSQFQSEFGLIVLICFGISEEEFHSFFKLIPKLPSSRGDFVLS